MRLTRVPLLHLDDHVINLNFLLNAYLESDDDDYPVKYGVRYFMDATAGCTDPEDGNPGVLIKCKTKKAAVEMLKFIATATDTVMIEESD